MHLKAIRTELDIKSHLHPKEREMLAFSWYLNKSVIKFVRG